ncbi:MAG: YihY/virulence factor BrkB family protein [Chloroflexi bacterium]|nr:YihY/virulence factor BrkB family protein [Chloroflexota bacterium]
MLGIWQQSVRAWQQSHQFILWISRHVQWWSRILLRAIRKAVAPETALTAASIGYFTLFSLFPLTLLTVAIASLWLDPLLAEGEIVTQLEFVAPALGDLLGDNLEGIVMNRGAVSGFAALILLWSGSNIFNVLTRAMDNIWDVDENRSAWRHRGFAILIALGICFLLLIAYFAEGAVLTIVGTLLPLELEPLRPYTTQLWAAFVSIALFGTLYFLLPHMTLTLRQVLPGAVIAGLLWELAKRAFLNFIGAYFTRSNLVYGSVATITVFLTWTYLSAIIFLFGGYINVAYSNQKQCEANVQLKEKGQPSG